MSWTAPPPSAAWRHGGPRAGFEVVRTAPAGGCWLLTGRTVAVEDGRPAPLLDGCLDVDLESSAMTNALPVRRLALAPGATAAVTTAATATAAAAARARPTATAHRRSTSPAG